MEDLPDGSSDSELLSAPGDQSEEGWFETTANETPVMDMEEIEEDEFGSGSLENETQIQQEVDLPRNSSRNRYFLMKRP